MRNELTLDLDLAAVSAVPHVDQWCGPWAILPAHLEMLAQAIQSLNLGSHLQEVSEGKNAVLMAGSGADWYSDYTMLTEDGIAVTAALGTLMKHRASMSRNTSTVALRRSIRAAAIDDRVKGIMVAVDSPGGTVAGTKDLAADIAAAAQIKPVHAYIEDLGASAAYWISSQASHLSAGPTALVGSIGTFAVVHDLSKLAEEQGVKVHVVKAGDHKGTGVPGTEVTDGQLAEMQRMIDGLNEHFLAGVQAGRGLSQATVKSLNDGRVHLAETAVDMQLIDAVESFDVAMDRLRQQTKTPNQKRSTSMTTSTADPIAQDVENDADAKDVDSKDTPAPPKVTTLDQRAELKRYMAAFGDTAGAKYFAEGLDYTDACESHIIALDEQLAAAEARADEAEAKLKSLSLGEDSAVDTGAPASTKKRTFAEFTRGNR